MHTKTGNIHKTEKKTVRCIKNKVTLNRTEFGNRHRLLSVQHINRQQVHGKIERAHNNVRGVDP